MFFIFGSPRSGTTLLAQALSRHHDIVIPYETDFIIPMSFIFDRISNEAIGKEMIIAMITTSRGYELSLGAYLSKKTIEDIVRNCEYNIGKILEAIYQELAVCLGKKMAGDKSPNDLMYLRKLVKTGGITEHTKVLHIVRDVRDVMVSLNEQDWLSDSDLYFPRFWSCSNLYLHSLYKHVPEKYHLIRYEDFVTDPEYHLVKICNFLGVAYSPVMLDANKTNPIYHDMPSHSRLFEKISSSRISRFKEILDEQTIQNYLAQASEAIKVFGYE